MFELILALTYITVSTQLITECIRDIIELKGTEHETEPLSHQH